MFFIDYNSLKQYYHILKIRNQHARAEFTDANDIADVQLVMADNAA